MKRKVAMCVAVVVVVVGGVCGVLFFHGGTKSPHAGMREASAQSVSASDSDFDYHWEMWKKHCQSVRLSSALEDYLDSPHYEALCDMGPAAADDFMEKTEEEPQELPLGWSFAWASATGISLAPEDHPGVKEFSMDEWWREGQSGTNKKFEKLFAEYTDLKKDGKQAAAEKKLKTIRYSLGIGALVPMMEKIKAGHEELLPLVKDLTDDEARIAGKTAQERIESCRQWWKENRGKWTIPFPDAGGQ